MKICSRLVLAVLALVAPKCFANNNYYFPGDAFFYFEIDQDEWKALQDGTLNVLKYDRPEHLAFAFCGYAGYEKIDLSSMSTDFRARFIAAVQKMKEQYPTKIEMIQKPAFFGGEGEKERVEKNKVRIFVYNKDFDFSKFRIALKYNESWPETAKSMGHQLQHFRFDYFVTTAQALDQSWRWGSSVDALEAEYPQYTDVPIPFNENMQILVAPPIPLHDLCFPGKEAKTECIAVSSDGTRKLVVGNYRKSEIWEVAD